MTITQTGILTITKLLVGNQEASVKFIPNNRKNDEKNN